VGGDDWVHHRGKRIARLRGLFWAKHAIHLEPEPFTGVVNSVHASKDLPVRIGKKSIRGRSR
jgi:hypothetical protein